MMSLSPATLSTEAKASNQEDSDSPRDQEADGEKSEHHDSNCNRDDDENEYGEGEEEDVDFNPLLKETVSLDASSSLSSEVDVLDADVVESGEDPSESSRTCCGKGFTSFLQDRPVGDKELGVEAVMRNRASSVPDIDNEDAICKRTRARYSLASFTMDELETFLQETDDEDDLQNGDDEEEYKKFLAAVLHGGDGVCGNIQVNENVDDDEDEDNDVDFELEIEEALESDLDEHLKDDDIEEEYKVASRRPKTRQTRCQRAAIQNNKISGLSNRPLRPLLPYLPNSLYSLHGAKSLMPRCSPAPLSPLPANGGFVNGFTPYQIGQLHCLIHEHVQLLIQVFSVCVLKPARRHIASDVRELISQMLHKRDQVLVNRKVPYPNFCFFSPYVHPSVSLKTSPAETRVTIPSQPFDRTNGFTNNQVGCPVGSWVPYISGPIVSVLDVAPLRLVKEFMDDISHAVQVYQRRQIGGMNHICSGMKPLFPLQNTHLTAEPDSHAVSYSNVGSPSSSSVRPSKKTMAAVLVEKAKEQAVSLVPEEISELAQRFYPLFNPALYPHKPTAAAAANRVLFTDAEDGLLALGMLEYNTDWKAIQQRYLPCKSKHQIFVRQKNRTSSKAPENPIKAVRRMKNSPLTEEEILRIEEGLRVFKLDWISVWKLIVPYRDPSLLPRLWRIATGTQKSYKKDATKNSKRRLHESDRRKSKGAALDTCHTSYDKEDDVADNAVEENNGADNRTDRVEDSYVHEAFFADWRPPVSSTQVTHDGAQKTSHYQLLGEENLQVARQMNHNCSRNDQSQISNESSRKFNNWQVVKLAPGLPPVNLPPSVRVISQSVFKSYEGGTYPRTLGGGACTNDSVRDTAVPKTAGAANPDTNYYAEDCNKSNQNLEETSQSVREGKDESGVQIHPLFFRAPEDGHYKSKATSSSFNFFSGSQPQLNLSHFHHSQQTAQTVDFLDSSCNLRDNTSILPGFEFHPLLQRSDNANCRLEAVSLPSCTSESSRGRCIRVQNAIPSNVTSRPIGKNNEVDLEMHLSSMGRSVTSDGDQNPPNCETPNRTTQQHDSMSDEENGNDLAEIVMEQEELSDSEEEIGESVEFECEEMEDSEGEEILESEQEMDKVSLDESCDQSVPDKANSCSISADHTARLDSDDKATDEQGSSLYLNLNSSGLVSPQVRSKSRHSNGSGKARKSAKNSRLDRKRQKSASDVPGQANRCSVVSANKKSRKRHRRTDSRKTDTSSTADMVTDRPKSTKKDEVG